MAALAAWVGTVLVAALVGTSGAIGLLGWGDYRYEFEVPVPGLALELGFQPSWGVVQVGTVCDEVNLRQPADDCYNIVLHQGEQQLDGDVWVAGDVRADDAEISGRLFLDASPGWNSLMASLYGMQVLSLLILAFLLAQLWLLLRAAARGQGFSEHAVFRLRILGWTMVAWEFVEPLLWLFFSPKANDYVAGATGPWPLLQFSSMEPGGPGLVVIAFGLLLVLLAELFRYGAELADEQQLTV
ncbi:DUF2975 domain-containing protein [Nocardioides sp. InS609-2]|uniref:DUF2975 domain-containing protein n=1 Tax=Nocardioides sp. InS609-2 TaxID=2760705 RepID=UPI0020BDC567|nr:DUF2975 domain-containing protein [Nocardioides sp. InS609-2]